MDIYTWRNSINCSCEPATFSRPFAALPPLPLPLPFPIPSAHSVPLTAFIPSTLIIVPVPFFHRITLLPHPSFPLPSCLASSTPTINAQGTCDALSPSTNQTHQEGTKEDQDARIHALAAPQHGPAFVAEEVFGHEFDQGGKDQETGGYGVHDADNEEADLRVWAVEGVCCDADGLAERGAVGAVRHAYDLSGNGAVLTCSRMQEP